MDKKEKILSDKQIWNRITKKDFEDLDFKWGNIRTAIKILLNHDLISEVFLLHNYDDPHNCQIHNLSTFDRNFEDVHDKYFNWHPEKFNKHSETAKNMKEQYKWLSQSIEEIMKDLSKDLNVDVFAWPYLAFIRGQLEAVLPELPKRANVHQFREDWALEINAIKRSEEDEEELDNDDSFIDDIEYRSI